MSEEDEVPSGAHGGFPRWLSAYVLLGLVQSGMVPMLLPLAAKPGATAGLTYAAFAASGLAAPLIGAWSDRHRAHRAVLVAGLALASIALFANALPGGLLPHLATAGLIGLGASSASTVATMFIVEVEPPASWDGRIGQLQACLSAGQLAGLLMAGVLGLHHAGAALILAASILLLAIPVSLACAPDPVTVIPRASLAPRPPRSGDAAAIGAQRHVHLPTRAALSALSHSGLAWLLAAWLLSYTASNGLSVMMAVAMVRTYHVGVALPTGAYALGAGLSLLIYARVASWNAQFGTWRVLRAGLAIRTLLVAGMFGLSRVRGGSLSVALILVLFVAIQFVWPLLSIASTALSVTLSPAKRAETVGLLNASTSLGATVGGAIGGVLLQDGFPLLCTVVAVALAVSVLFAWHPRVRLRPPVAVPGADPARLAATDPA